MIFFIVVLKLLHFLYDNLIFYLVRIHYKWLSWFKLLPLCLKTKVRSTKNTITRTNYTTFPDLFLIYVISRNLYILQKIVDSNGSIR